MKSIKISAMVCALTVAAAMTVSVTANAAGQELTPTDAVHKFDLGSKEVGGSGVEPEGSDDGKNWIKVVQSSNAKLKLFEDVGPDVNVTALQVTFEISQWSGKEYSISWGANIDFFNDATTTWCGTDAFSGISEYTITGDGDYTVVCDLAALAESQGKEGISNLQTCEMVIDHVAEGDTTQIEVKSAKIYVDGEVVEIPEQSDSTAGESESGDSESSSDIDSTADSSEPSSEQEGDEQEESSSSESENTAGSETAGADTAADSKPAASASATAASSSASSSASASTPASTASTPDNSNADTGAASGIALACLTIAGAAMVVSKRK